MQFEFNALARHHQTRSRKGKICAFGDHIGLASVGCFTARKGEACALPLFRQTHAVSRVQIDHAHTVIAHVFREQFFLGGKIILEVGMKVEMILRQVGENGALEAHASARDPG